MFQKNYTNKMQDWEFEEITEEVQFSYEFFRSRDNACGESIGRTLYEIGEGIKEKPAKRLLAHLVLLKLLFDEKQVPEDVVLYNNQLIQKICLENETDLAEYFSQISVEQKKKLKGLSQYPTENRVLKKLKKNTF